MTAPECDHCDEAVAELMSMVDHDFTGTEVRGLNVHVRRLLAAERAKVLAEVIAMSRTMCQQPSGMQTGTERAPVSFPYWVTKLVSRLGAP